MTRPDLRALAEAFVTARAARGAALIYDPADLESFASTVAAAERARIVAGFRARARRATNGEALGWTYAADELEADQ